MSRILKNVEHLLIDDGDPLAGGDYQLMQDVRAAQGDSN